MHGVLFQAQWSGSGPWEGDMSKVLLEPREQGVQRSEWSSQHRKQPDKPLADEATSTGKSGSLGARGVALKDRLG